MISTMSEWLRYCDYTCKVLWKIMQHKWCGMRCGVGSLEGGGHGGGRLACRVPQLLVFMYDARSSWPVSRVDWVDGCLD